ncbi:MAG TPA: LamG-like jellyroll fold domain-containing protein [Planctomycetota bacterium]|nr:LamG-like jellyroll fold domain-containing protein [Planctomycetota bacterium]
MTRQVMLAAVMVVLVACAASAPAWANPITTDLVAHWRFELPGGGSLGDTLTSDTDVVGSLVANRNGTTGNVTYGAPAPAGGGTASADLTPNRHLLVADSDVLTGHDGGGSGFSTLVIEALIRPDVIAQSVILRKYQSAQNDNGYWLDLRTGGSVYFHLGNASTSTEINTSGGVAAGNWYRVRGVWNGSLMNLYLDDELRAIGTYTATLANTDLPMGIGSIIRDTAGTNIGQSFDGRIDEVKIGTLAPPPEGLRAYSGIDYIYTNSVLSGKDSATDVGFAGAWTDATNSVALATPPDASSLAFPANVPFEPLGKRIQDSGGGTCTRALASSAALDMDADQNYYVSFLARRTGSGGSDWFGLEFDDGDGDPDLGFGAGSDDLFRIVDDSVALGQSSISVVNGTTYLFVARIDANSGATPDQFFLEIYGPSDLVDIAPAVWDVTGSKVLSLTLDNLVASFGSGGTWALDEIRIGDTWLAVTGVTGQIPEPGTLTLLALGGLGLARRRRRRAQ